MAQKSKTDLLKALSYIDPAPLEYTDWVKVGMALKAEGYTANDWDKWSQADTRFHDGECFKKWGTFDSSGVTGATIMQMAKDRGYQPGTRDSYALEWDAVIGSREGVVVDPGWIESEDLTEPGTSWDPVADATRYLETLFDSDDIVGYVTESYPGQDGQKRHPGKGVYTRTAGDLIQALNGCNGDVCKVFGDYDHATGAWIRFNPLDGKGVKNENVTDYKYALVESDSLELGKQVAIIRELQLPVAAMVYSGGKSIHAIVRVDAANHDEYRKRVEFLFDIMRKNGFDIDTQNKNPSRLSRLPGVMRGTHKQWLIDTNIGLKSWRDWNEWIESVNDDLPDPVCLADVWDNMPDLAPTLIDGVLRQGHKMLVAGPSKAGKSFLLIELCIAIAEGSKWLGFQCAQGKVLYVNLEVDDNSCLHRFKDMYEALNIAGAGRKNIDIWQLRGEAEPMDKLAPKLIRRAQKQHYIAIVIDPIYKVITGDENSADQMAAFCNQFDIICSKLGASVIYCHHHSKGAQGAKRAMDRASGSGVFARDPDAVVDIIQLDTGKDDIGDDCTAWKVEGTLREFPSFKPVYCKFKHPIHTVDDDGELEKYKPFGEVPSWQKANEASQNSREIQKADKELKLYDAYKEAAAHGVVTTLTLAKATKQSKQTIKNQIDACGFLERDNNGVVMMVEDDDDENFPFD